MHAILLSTTKTCQLPDKSIGFFLEKKNGKQKKKKTNERLINAETRSSLAETGAYHLEGHLRGYVYVCVYPCFVRVLLSLIWCYSRRRRWLVLESRKSERGDSSRVWWLFRSSFGLWCSHDSFGSAGAHAFDEKTRATVQPARPWTNQSQRSRKKKEEETCRVCCSSHRG